MFSWLFGPSKKPCGLCQKEFKSKTPDIIHIEDSEGNVERIEICAICASELEIIKLKNKDANYHIDIG